MESVPTEQKPDLSSALLVSNVVLTVIGAIFVTTRLWVRFFNTKVHGWDDYFISGSLAASLASMGVTIAMVDHGYGKSIYLLEPSEAVQALKFSNFAVLINGFSMAFLKLSIGLSLIRLQLGKGMFWIVVGSIVLSVVCNMLVIVTTLFGCRPLAAKWDRTLLPEADCLPPIVSVSNSYIQTGGNIVTDLFYTLGPLYYLSKVKVSVYNKWALRGVFLIGLLATICAIAKCFELPKLKSITDPTADGALITIWVRAELNAGLVAAAIPPLKSVFEQVLRNVFGVQSGLRSHTGYVSQPPLSSRRSRFRGLEDDEIAMRSYAARVQANDIESVEEDERNAKASVSDGGEYGKGRDGWITKTVGYTVRDDQLGDHVRK